MTFDELKKESNHFRPAFWYDDFLSRTARTAVRLVSLLAALALLALGFEIMTTGTAWMLALLYLDLAVLASLSSFEFYYHALYYARLPSGQTFELAEVVRVTDASDITKGFVASPYGSEALKRLGLGPEELSSFLAARRSRLASPALALEAPVTLSSYADAIYRTDAEFKDFLFARGVLERDWVGAIEWIERVRSTAKEKGRWWSRRNLEKVQGIGKAWSYGQVWLLEKYGSRFELSHDLTPIDVAASYHRAEVDELEVVLSRATEANALVVGEDSTGNLDVVARLTKRIVLGSAHPAVEHKQVFILDQNALIAATGDKNRFELEIMRVMKQAIKAGNIVLVIPDLPSFMTSAASLGSDIVSILDPYLASSAIQVVALCDTMSYHQSIEANSALVERFEKVTVKGGSDEETIRLLEDRLAEYERPAGVFFTYQALVSIADSADRYFVTGVMPDKALDLLVETIAVSTSKGKRVITKADILELVEAKTGIPVAGVKDEEREKLMNLEKILHERVIGQDAAIDAIANAMRRARSGVANPQRPMGSFLFIGPTGVGKTETTKALAHVFFGNENKIVRFDMSEYSGDDSLSRLLGSFQSGKAGTLTTALRENPYGVLLLDEFEKANKEVHNLFLQILDEGMFADMVGKKVNARNLIIIATSNAGSDKIWELAQAGQDVATAKDAIVDEIIKKAIFKPELMNRFDGVVLYHPLKEEHLREVARIMLERLKKRLEERRINLAVTDALVNFLVKQGSDPKFGARPLNRAIQDRVESLIAEKMIKGNLSPGSVVELTESDLSS